jgi:hypothetical protein
MTFLEAPSVHREDVTSKLASIDTCYKHPTSSGDAGLIPGGDTGGSWPTGTADGDAKRVWHVKNLLVAFDDNGVHAKTRSHRQRPRTLAGIAHLCRPDACARSFQAPLPPANFGLLLRHFASGLPGGHGQEERPGPFSSSSIIRFDHESSKDNRQNSGVTCHTLHFSEKTAFGRKLILCGNAEMVVTLFESLQQTAPKTMLWE